MIWWRRASCPSFPIDRLEACPTGLYEASGATAGSPSPAIRGISYAHSQKFVMNGVVLLDNPAVAPTCQSVITFENCYKQPRGKSAAHTSRALSLSDPFQKFDDIF
jgi:hypothetical protein